jgi:hypothetical protein
MSRPHADFQLLFSAWQRVSGILHFALGIGHFSLVIARNAQ